MELELQIFLGQAEQKCRSGTSAIFTGQVEGSVEVELQNFTGQVEQKCGSGTSDFHMPSRAEVRKRNCRFSNVQWNENGTSGLHGPG